MAGRKPTAIRPVDRVQPPSVEDVSTQRAFDVLGQAVQELQARRTRDVATHDLVVGSNKVRHNLGRACVGYILVPTAADATFAHAIDKTNPRPDLEVWITVIGVAQPGAIVEVF